VPGPGDQPAPQPVEHLGQGNILHLGRRLAVDANPVALAAGFETKEVSLGAGISSTFSDSLVSWSFKENRKRAPGRAMPGQKYCTVPNARPCSQLFYVGLAVKLGEAE